MEGIHPSDDPVQFQVGQQRLGGGNLVAFVGHSLDPQGASALRIDGSNQLGALTAAQSFAIQHHHAAVGRAMPGVLPLPESGLKLHHRHRFEHPVKTIFRGRFIGAGFWVEPAAHRCPLDRTQVPCKRGHCPVSALAAGEQIGKGDRQHGGLSVAQAFDVPAFADLPVQHLPQAAQIVARQQAGRINVAFVNLERSGQLPLP